MAKINGRKLCEYCFAPMEASDISCPECGINPGSHPSLPDALKVGRRLTERYVIGKMLAHDEESFTYLAYDTERESRIMIREYFPKDMVFRKFGDPSLRLQPGQPQEALEQGKADFLQKEEMQAEQAPIINILRNENNTVYVLREYLEVSRKAEAPREEVFSPETPVQEEVLFVPGDNAKELHSKEVMHRKDEAVKGKVSGGVIAALAGVIVLILALIVVAVIMVSNAGERLSNGLSFHWGEDDYEEEYEDTDEPVSYEEVPLLSYITDEVGVLDEEVVDYLTDLCGQIEEITDYGVYVGIIEGEYDMDPDILAENLFWEYQLGAGRNDSGVFLLVNTETGESGIYAAGGAEGDLEEMNDMYDIDILLETDDGEWDLSLGMFLELWLGMVQ